MPWQRFLLESDAPDQPIDGLGRGEPTGIHAVAELISEIRGCTKDRVRQSSKMLCTFWSILVYFGPTRMDNSVRTKPKGLDMDGISLHNPAPGVAG